MPILSDLSRRFHMLTTDARPEPPRVPIEGYTHNLPPSDGEKGKSRSVPTTPEREEEGRASTQRQKSLPDEAIPTTAERKAEGGSGPSTADAKEQKRPGVKTKTKSRQYKHSQSANVVNYNIVNSNGVKIGSRTSYICNVNQFPAGNTAASSEDPWSKPKFRQMPAEVERLTCCTEEIALDDIFVLKTHVGHGWRDVARRLSFSDGQIEQFEENYKHRGVDEVIYQLLLDWKQANTKDAQIGNLVNILWACQEYDCAERLVASRKSRC